MQQQPIEIYVHPTQGDDTATGDSLAPFKTLTRALQQAKPGTTIQLSRGVYSTEQGEQFPIVVPPGVSLAGNEAGQGLGTVLQGSGSYQSALFGSQSVTVVLSEAAELRGVTVTNTAAKGTGIWIESVAAVVSGCTMVKCSREGVLVTGTASPTITTCLFQENAASGVTFVRHARGEVRSNLYRLNGFGIAVSDRAAPLIVSNQIFENRCGVVLSGQAAPVLRGNIVAQNSEDGLVVAGKASPDLGNQGDPAGNQFRDNRRFDLRNATEQGLILSGNYLNPARVSGAIELVSLRSPVSALARFKPTPLPQLAVPATPSHAPADLQSHWATPLIQPLLDRQILLLSEGRFNPDASLDAAELTQWIKAALGQSPNPSFSSRPLTRLQTVVTLVKAANLSGGQPSLLNGYGDRSQIPSTQVLDVATALQYRLIVLPSVQSASGQLNLLHAVTRAEAAAMLYQTLVAKTQAGAIDLPQILRPEAVQNRVAAQPIKQPVVVLDPGHGGADTGVVLQAESAETAEMPSMPLEMMPSMGLPMSPLPAGERVPGRNPGLPPSMMPGMMPGMMPPGMPPEPMPDDPSIVPDLKEKEIVLSIAKAVAGFLSQQGMQVILTRSDDRDLTLAERLEVARQHQADAFISLHANANLNNQADDNGVETYYNPDSIEGARLAWAIHKALTRTSDIDDRGVHAATFATLRHDLAVATQVEVGYITGSKDGSSLANSAFHRYLARAIANGITRYIRQRQ